MTLSKPNPKVSVYGAPARRSAAFPFVLTKDGRILGTVSKSQMWSKIPVDWLGDLLIALEGEGTEKNMGFLGCFLVWQLKNELQSLERGDKFGRGYFKRGADSEFVGVVVLLACVAKSPSEQCS